MRATNLALLILLVAATPASSATFLVDSEGSEPDAVPGDGVCASALGTCTLPAAVDESNALAGLDSVWLPAGTFPAVDVDDDLELAGAGSSITTIQAISAFGDALDETPLQLAVHDAGVGSWLGVQAVAGSSLELSRVHVHGDLWFTAPWPVYIGYWVYPSWPDRLVLVNSVVDGDLITAAPSELIHTTVNGVNASVSGWSGQGSILATCNTGNASIPATSSSYTIDLDGSCGLNDPTDLPNTDPMLDASGVPTPGSPAIDAIPATDCVWDHDGDPATAPTPILEDLRAIRRPQGAGCDIGAVERLTPPPGPICGIGPELALVLPMVAWARRRRRA